MKIKGIWITIAAVMAITTPAFAQDCLVEEAAQAALERELALIEELAADPEESFSGPDSCLFLRFECGYS